METLVRAGRDLAAWQLVSTRGGNLSQRSGEEILITRTGAMLGRLEPHDLVTVGLEPGPRDEHASGDLAVHREIYRRTQAAAVVHAHPSSVVALAYTADVLVPEDHEGRIFVPRAPVIDEREPRHLVAAEVADRIATGAAVVVVRTHGTYAAAGSLDDALHRTTSLELSARILLARR